MPSASDINTKVDDAVTAIEAGDWMVALTKLLAAKAMLSSRIDSSQSDQSLNWDRSAIDTLIADIRRQQNASKAGSLGIQKTNVKYVPATDNP